MGGCFSEIARSFCPITKIGQPNWILAIEIGWKMANGQLLYVAVPQLSVDGCAYLQQLPRSTSALDTSVYCDTHHTK